MSIGKIFAKVFGEELFDEKQQESPPPACGLTTAAEHIRMDQLCLPEQAVMVKDWLQRKSNEIDVASNILLNEALERRKGRLGPDTVLFDVDSPNLIRISSDRLKLRSVGSFNTIKSNVCVHAGAWQYEVHLHSKGVMQIGWCTSQCQFNDNSGVGDTKWSYGYDGSKQQIWHISTKKYGLRWQVGDIIGVCMNLKEQTINFYRNGKDLGVAFNHVELRPGISYFAAVSLGYNQAVRANFGGTPFKYPVEGYEPLEIKPYALNAQAELFISYLVNISLLLTNTRKEKDKYKDKDPEKFSTRKTVYVYFCSLIIDRVAPTLVSNYVIEDQLLTYIARIYALRNEADKDNISPGAIDSTLGTFLSLLWNYMEGEEIRFVMKKLANSLMDNYTMTHEGLNYQKQREAIALINYLCNHPITRKFYLEYKFFKKHYLPLLMHIRAPEFDFLKTYIPDMHVWTEGLGGSKNKYVSTCEKMGKQLEPLYNLQKDLLITLLTNNDATFDTPSSRKIFLTKLRRYVMEVSMEQRPYHSLFVMQSNIMPPIENQISLSFLCILLDVAKQLFEKELSNSSGEINIRYFYDGTYDYQHYDRLGGVLSHLRKVHRNEISARLGTDRAAELAEEDRTVIRGIELDPTMFLTSANVNTISIVNRSQSPASHYQNFFPQRHAFDHRDIDIGSLPADESLCEIVDICLLYYYAAGHKYIVKIASTRDEIASLNDSMRETKQHRELIEFKLSSSRSSTGNENYNQTLNDMTSKFVLREDVFMKRSIVLARKQAWFRAHSLSRNRRLLFIWLLDKVLKTLMTSSNIGALFTFVPEVYVNVLPILLDTVMDFSYHEVMLQYDTADAECVINGSADFLGMHAADPRIVLASCKDSLLQALGTLMCHKPGIRALEKTNRRSQIALIRSLLRPYENRAWGQSNWLLLRFWLGDGFAFRDARQPSVWQGGNEPVPLGLCRSRAKNETHTGLLHHVAPAFPSRYFQKFIGTRLTEDEPYATVFMNSVLSQLNWAFSEFILLLQEIQNTAQRQENTIVEPKQMKICSMCYELTVSLLRCLEMIVNIAPAIFQDPSRPNSDLILNRVCQLISQVLSRVTVPPGCFQFIVDMCSADLNAVTHFPIITAAMGILIALMRTEMENDKNAQKLSRVSRALLTDPSFQFANLEFALGEIKTPILQQGEIPRGNFDGSSRPHIDPLTNDVRVPMPTTAKRIRADPPIIKFALTDFPTHINKQEVDLVRRLIENLRSKQALLSDIALPSEDSLCPICCAKPIAVTFTPCKHQSCSNCILQHLMNSKLCFYCKSMIKTIETADGTVIWQNNEYIANPQVYESF